MFTDALPPSSGARSEAPAAWRKVEKLVRFTNYHRLGRRQKAAVPAAAAPSKSGPPVRNWAADVARLVPRGAPGPPGRRGAPGGPHLPSRPRTSRAACDGRRHVITDRRCSPRAAGRLEIFTIRGESVFRYPDFTWVLFNQSHSCSSEIAAGSLISNSSSK